MAEPISKVEYYLTPTVKVQGSVWAPFKEGGAPSVTVGMFELKNRDGRDYWNAKGYLNPGDLNLLQGIAQQLMVKQLSGGSAPRSDYAPPTQVRRQAPPPIAFDDDDIPF